MRTFRIRKESGRPSGTPYGHRALFWAFFLKTRAKALIFLKAARNRLKIRLIGIQQQQAAPSASPRTKFFNVFAM